MKLKRIYGGWSISGRRRYIELKWLRPGVRAIRSGIWRAQLGRLLVRVAWRLRWCPCCKRHHQPRQSP